MNITLLDGGVGLEVVYRAGDKPSPLFSTQAMIDHPGIVADVHRDFCAAGSTIATTNSYAIHHDRLAGTPLEGQFEALYAMAINKAQGSGATRIAGSIGPLVASYRTDVLPPHEVAVSRFNEVANRLAQDVDLLICETVVSLAHARAVLQAAAQVTGKPVWIAFSVDDQDGTRLRSGEALADAMIVASAADAVMVDCSSPEAV